MACKKKKLGTMVFTFGVWMSPMRYLETYGKTLTKNLGREIMINSYDTPAVDTIWIRYDIDIVIYEIF